MPSVRYYNQTAPFWDFVASLEEQGSTHPFFAGHNNDTRPSNPWEGGWGFPFGGFPHRGRPGPPQAGPSTSQQRPSPQGPPPPEYQGPSTHEPEKEKDPQEGPSEPRGPPPPFSDEPGKEPKEPGKEPEEPGRGPCGRGRCGPRSRGPWGARGHCGRGPAFAHHGPMGGFGALADMFQSQLFGENQEKARGDDTFSPDVDVFDTAEAFVVHISLSGAKKEDVGVSWDAEKSELNIAGVVHRPGDEEFLKNLALDERKVGMFERKVRLGSRANPAQIDVDAISARMEDGVLRVEIPKLDAGYVEVKKVDVE